MPRKSITVRAVKYERPGQPTKYKAEMIRAITTMAQNGMTDRAIAEALGVTYTTFRNWVGRHEKLRAALVIPKQTADADVEYSLYQQAKGYDYLEEDIRVFDGQLVKVEVRKHQPPNVTAALAWLNNRKRAEWSRNPEPDYVPEPTEEVQKLTPDNIRGLARQVVLLLTQGVKAA